VKTERRTAAAVEVLKQAMLDATSEAPKTLRTLFYILVAKRLVPKTEQGYGQVKAHATNLRREARLAWDRIIDEGRNMVEPYTFVSAEERFDNARAALEAPRDRWLDQPRRVFVVAEKEGHVSLLAEVTRELHVPLIPLKGFTVGFLHTKVAPYLAAAKENHFLAVSDHDPSGHELMVVAERELRDARPECEIAWTRLAITTGQVEQYGLPTRPTKPSSHSRDFDGDSIEVEALEAYRPGILAEMLWETVDAFTDHGRLKVTAKRQQRDRREAARMIAEEFGA
jgi:hypothetical protein